MKKLIVRADDLGYSEGVTYGMLAAHREGIVTSCAVMINMPFATQAIELAKDYPNLALGLHVNVTNGKCIANKELIPSLVDETGTFLSSTYRRQQIKNGETMFNEDEAYIEAKAQLDLFIKLTGHKPDYIDVHVLEQPELVNACVRVKEEFGLISCYGDDPFVEMKDQSQGQYEFYKHETKDFVKYFEEGHFKFENDVEMFVCHPAFIDYFLTNTSSMIQERLYDFGFVTDPRVKQWLIDNNIELTKFKK